MNDGAYSIYVFEKNKRDQTCSFWRRHSTLREKKQAMDYARALFGSGDYCRVEVKCRSFDRRSQCQRDRTLKYWAEKRELGAGTELRLWLARLFS